MWKVFDGSDAEWQALLIVEEKSTYLHDIYWAKHYQSLGWKPVRWIFKENSRPIEFLQGLLKTYPFQSGVLWFPDWLINGINKSFDLGEILKKSLNLDYLYIRFRATRDYDVNDYAFLIGHGWKNPKALFNKGLTMSLNISSSIEDLYSGFTKNWRKSLKKSEKHSYSVRKVEDTEIVITLYEELRMLKSLRKEAFFSVKEINSIIDSFGENILIFGAFSEEDKPLAIRGCIIRGDVAYDIFAATGTLSRKLNTSHGLFVELIKECKKQGCKSYDLSGIDPESGPGVFNFKKGTGATIKKQLGEFEWSNSSALSFLIQIYSKYR